MGKGFKGVFKFKRAFFGGDGTVLYPDYPGSYAKAYMH